MCTMLTVRTEAGSFAGRNLDLDTPFGEKAVITPSGTKLQMKCGSEMDIRFTMTGMAAVAGGWPLYAEAVNTRGLAMAGLNFPGCAVYHKKKDGFHNVTPYELIPWVLGSCTSAEEARELLSHTNLLAVPFSDGMPLAPLHFMVTDSTSSFVAEPMEDGLRLYDDPYDVMTNNPPFEYHTWNIRNYRHLAANDSADTFSPVYKLEPYAAGMGAIGLPGDSSSASRFVKAAFGVANTPKSLDAEGSITQTFHLLDSVAMTDGAVTGPSGKNDITRYSCVMDLSSGDFYYKTYWNSRITKISPEEAGSIKAYELRLSQDIYSEN